MPEQKQEPKPKLRFIAKHGIIMRGREYIGRATSHEMAKRLARLLNEDDAK